MSKWYALSQSLIGPVGLDAAIAYAVIDQAQSAHTESGVDEAAIVVEMHHNVCLPPYRAKAALDALEKNGYITRSQITRRTITITPKFSLWASIMGGSKY